ncbi:MAG: efflux RND transporter periplasmic adaptor subunit [Pseudomonadota bacterium]
MFHRLTIILTFLTLSLALADTRATAQGRAAMVGVETVGTRSISETIPIFAEVVTSREGTVASRITGTVDQVNVLEGSAVEEGDVLVELDTELLEILARQAEARRDEAAAGIATAESNLDRSTNNLARIEGLRDTTSFSSSRFDDAQSDFFQARGLLAEAEARLKTAEANLAEAGYQLERARITAPFTGIVLEVTTNPGEFISSGAAVVTLLDTQAFEIEASVPARYISVLEPGLNVLGSTETEEQLDLTVRVLLPVEDQATRTRPVRFSSPALQGREKIAIGQSMTVSIPVSAPRDVLSVPKDALVQARGGWTVYVVEEDKAQPRQVQVGVALGDRFEVLGGLVEGDLVVTRGNERLRPGQDVAPIIGDSEG